MEKIALIFHRIEKMSFELDHTPQFTVKSFYKNGVVGRTIVMIRHGRRRSLFLVSYEIYISK